MHLTKQNEIIAALLLILGKTCSGNVYQQQARPHIVIIMADDLGWNDVGFHGSNQIPTPNIDALAYDGVILNRHYTAPMCTPSRAAMMTGRNPISIGMQHYVIDTDQPWGLGLDQKIMPEYFREAGYRTHLVGKWHLGFFAQQYTPLRRGFDSHVGYYAPYVDYWDYTNRMSDPQKQYVGYDLRHNWDIDVESNGTYATDHFTNAASRIIAQHNERDPLFLMVNHLAPHAGNDNDPLQAPQQTIDKFSYIADKDRRIYAAMMSKLDDSVGEIFKALRTKNMLRNSIILFISDNGAPSVGLHANIGSNFPLRGQKNSPWEGATRNVAAIWSPLIQERQRVSNQFVHISDWLPTLAAAAGINLPYSKNHSEIDGIDQWESLSFDTGNPRRVILNMIDEVFGYSSYMENGYKYVNGTTIDGKFDEWYGELQSDNNPTDEYYYQQLSESPIGESLRNTLTKDQIKYLRKHATINCKSPLNPTKCNPKERPCLFDIINDPCERNDISSREPNKFRELRAKVDAYRRSAAKIRNKPADPAANPANFGGVWNWWRRDQPVRYSDDVVSHQDLEIPPPHSTLPEDIQLTVIISIVVVGVVFVSGALIYLSNKNLLRMFRCRKDIPATGSTTTDSTFETHSAAELSRSGSTDGKLSNVLGQSYKPNAKVYHVSNNSLDRF